MLILKCTQKAATEFGLRNLPVVEDGGETAVLGAWFVNQFLFGRTKTLLFTNEATLYSVLIPYLKKDLADLPALFTQHLTAHLALELIPPPVLERLTSSYQAVTFGKTDSRSVLGTMNDVGNMLKDAVPMHGGPQGLHWPLVMYDINRVPLLKQKSTAEKLLHQRLAASVDGSPDQSLLTH